MIQNKRNVMDLWRASEMLTIPEVPDPNGKDLFYATKYGGLPWEGQNPRKAREKHTLFYVVYLGVIGKAEAHARMAAAYGAPIEEGEFREAREFDAQCFSAVLFLNSDGEPVEEGAFKPFQTADYILGYAQKCRVKFQEEKISTLKKHLYEEFRARFATPVGSDPGMSAPVLVRDTEAFRLNPSAFESVTEIERPTAHDPSDKQTVPFDWDRFDREERYLRHLAPYLFDPWDERVLIRSVEVKNKDVDEKRNTYALMPNFYLDDLDWIGRLSPNAEHGALKHILTSSADDDCSGRVDLLKAEGISALDELLSAKNMPPARWPSNPEHHLMMGQQAAVNSIWELSERDGSGLRAVNGPPGTGKTTLLRDVIANIITQRAFEMANAKKSSELFETTNDNHLSLVLPVEALRDSGIVVTSNNNSAVENISAELPDAAAIDEHFQGADFLRLSGAALLNAKKKNDEPWVDAWGSIAAQLGNMENRSAFEKAWHPKVSENEDLPPLGQDLKDAEGGSSFKEAKERLFDCRRKLTQIQQMVQHVPDDVIISSEAHLLKEEAERQLMSFNVNKDLEIARAELFVAALDLHRAVLSENYEALKETLTLCNTMVGSGLWGKNSLSAANQKRLWDLLFLCVPVVSTSLASINRMFGQFQGGEIPWLLIDEAGQATPSSAAGALWRAKRAVIVGDPLQVEPVATFEEKSVGAIADVLGVGANLTPAGNSVQTMADRAMSVGAYIGSGSEAVWGGLPLRAHRRCVDPMFRIANKIAYGNQMVQANKNGAELEFPLKESCWIDVASPSSEGHVNRPEIEFVKKVRKWISEEHKASRGTPSVFFISPFKKVATACGGAKLPGVEAGSVHAFQGKEADIVFIVLGSAAGKKGAGSRKWAGETPNILNVALTRAKKRVYIVGAISDWGNVDHFSVLAQDMKDDRQVIGVEEALDRLGIGGEDASEGAKEATKPVQKKLAFETKKAAKKAKLNWRSLAEIWKEKGGEPGLRVVRENWKDPYSGNQYTLLTEGQVTEAEVNFVGSYTQIKDGYEKRGAPRGISNHADPSWVILEEALSVS